jgi:hypothetical protein
MRARCGSPGVCDSPPSCHFTLSLCSSWRLLRDGGLLMSLSPVLVGSDASSPPTGGAQGEGDGGGRVEAFVDLEGWWPSRVGCATGRSCAAWGVDDVGEDGVDAAGRGWPLRDGDLSCVPLLS